MSFHVGQKVVAIAAKEGERTGSDLKTELRAGQVYTVRSIAPEYLPYYGMVGIRVEEFIAPFCGLGSGQYEPATLACYFRPVIERKTDISIFTEMLAPNKQMENQT